MELNPATRTLVVAHDAGGAEVVSSWIRRHYESEYAFLLEGPAEGIFRRKCGSICNHRREELPELLSVADLVLCGSSWGSNLEKVAVRRARAASVPSAVYLDHWTNYRERLELLGEIALPDLLWVGDEYGLMMARELFPAANVRCEPNPYFEDSLADVVRCGRSAALYEGTRQVLYLTEPIVEVDESQNYTNRPGYTESEALIGFFNYLKDSPFASATIRLRIHPAERAEKYDQTIAAFSGDLAIEVSRSTTLAEDIAASQWVVGLDTTAMVIGVLAGKRVSSAIPKGGRPPQIPYPQIERLFQ